MLSANDEAPHQVLKLRALGEVMSYSSAENSGWQLTTHGEEILTTCFGYPKRQDVRAKRRLSTHVSFFLPHRADSYIQRPQFTSDSRDLEST